MPKNQLFKNYPTEEFVIGLLNIYGIQDAIKTNKSGLLFQSGNVQDLFEKMYN